MVKKAIDYSKGKLYKMASPNTDKIYIGSTTKKYLCQRIGTHRTQYKRYQNGKTHYLTSFEILGKGGAYIELIENFPCKTKDELHAREGQLIRENKDTCVNHVIPGRTDEQYYMDNKDIILAKNQEYRDSNRDIILDGLKKYKASHKEERKAYDKIKFTCSCGKVLSQGNKSNHQKTKRHLEKIGSK